MLRFGLVGEEVGGLEEGDEEEMGRIVSGGEGVLGRGERLQLRWTILFAERLL